MKILVTGAKGFIGSNLVETLKTIRDGKKQDTDLSIDEIYEFDKSNSIDDLKRYCMDCDFVFNLAGVNRPDNEADFDLANRGFAEKLLDALVFCNNNCPVMLASSTQASLVGRFAGSVYGKSKLAGEELYFKYYKETGNKVLVYRFPNVFGKWCRPNYNSAVATFCHAIANDLPYTVNDRNTELELLYIDDLVNEMLSALDGNEHRCEYILKPGEGASNICDCEPTANGRYCYVPTTHKATLGFIADTLCSFSRQPETLLFESIPHNSLEKKLYSTYLSYLPEDKTIFDLCGAEDNRGIFTEIFKNKDIGQFSINVSKPGEIRGQHWHHTKAEIFVVVSGKSLIQERRIGINPDTGEEYPMREYHVSGDRLQAVYMLPGFTHNIINLSDTDDLITVMWANEIFDEKHSETYREVV